jgi:hypothetical protein
VRIPPGVRRGRLDFVDDFDDVIRFPLRRGERLRATLSGVDQRTEYIDMLLFGPSTTDVTDTRQMPLDEDSDRDEFAPERLVHTARRDGPHFLDIVGVGSYELRWSIRVPGAVGALRATPQRFSPDADGVRDTTDITWRLRRRGVPTLRISDSQGRVVRTRSYGPRAPGDMAFRWRGRGDGGEDLPAGRYDVRLAWRDGRGRVSSAATAVELRR